MDHRPDCTRVLSLAGQHITITGTVVVDGRHRIQKHCQEDAARMGAAINEDWAEKVTLLVQGYLIDNVADKANRRSQKILAAQQSHVRGRHVHVVDSDGFTSLLHGLPAACLQIVDEGDKLRLSRRNPIARPTAPLTVLGELWKPRATPSHPTTHLELDLSALDAGTAAHEHTARRLHEFWASRNITTHTPGRGLPPFDLGWRMPDGRLYIAEIKSLTDTNETQQIRLAIGQVLDYLDAVTRAMGPDGPSIGAVIALERAPSDRRWYDITRQAGVTLVHGPDFRSQSKGPNHREVGG